jgi:hypothetical protein
MQFLESLDDAAHRCQCGATTCLCPPLDEAAPVCLLYASGVGRGGLAIGPCVLLLRAECGCINAVVLLPVVAFGYTVVLCCAVLCSLCLFVLVGLWLYLRRSRLSVLRRLLVWLQNPSTGAGKLYMRVFMWSFKYEG